jgi:NitT/TauT family transport system substrate-binding protein
LANGGRALSGVGGQIGGQSDNAHRVAHGLARMTRTLTEVHIVDAGGPHEVVNVELLNRRGYLEQMGIRASKTYVSNGAEATALVLGGHCDVAMQVGFGPALSAIVNGAPLRIIAASNLLTVHAVYSKKPEIRRLRDLEHRTVGVGALGALTHQLIYAALHKSGIDPAAVRFVSIGNSATIFRALLAGEVDAGFGETDVFENQAHYGVHSLDDGVLWRELPEFPNQASFASKAAIRGKRDALVRTLAAHALLYRYLHSPDSWNAYAAARAAALSDADPVESRTQWLFYQHHHPYAEDLLLPEAQLRYMQDLNVTMKLQRRVLPFDAVTDMSLARDALRLIDVQAGHKAEARASV